MKIRKGFVSNSSTTSFTCDACGKIVAYHDSCSNSDMDITRYSCGHGTCGCITLDLNDKDIQKKNGLNQLKLI